MNLLIEEYNKAIRRTKFCFLVFVLWVVLLSILSGCNSDQPQPTQDFSVSYSANYVVDIRAGGFLLSLQPYFDFPYQSPFGIDTLAIHLNEYLADNDSAATATVTLGISREIEILINNTELTFDSAYYVNTIGDSSITIPFNY